MKHGAKKILKRLEKLSLNKLFSSKISPALLLPAEFYDDIIDGSMTGKNAVDSVYDKAEKYTAFYVKATDKVSDIKAGDINSGFEADEKHLGQKEECANSELKNNVIDLTEDYSVEEWLGYIKNAKRIVTDQREAVDMAVAYKIPLMILGEKSDASMYAQNLGLQNCIVNEYNEEKWNEIISGTNYENVMNIVQKEREAVFAGLSKALKKEKWTAQRVKAGVLRRIPRRYKDIVKNTYRKMRG